MEAVAIALVLSMVATVDDPRAPNARHRLVDILAIALLATLAGVDDYPGIVEYGRDRFDFLKRFMTLPHGIPSLSTFRRVFAKLDPEGLAEVLRRWAAELVKSCQGKQIAIDGKALRRSFEHAWKKLGLHVVTAWCVEDDLVLAQQAVDEKSNEITAVPQLLDMLDIKGAVVTVDALNTQKAIAGQIIEAGGDYVMALKDNHPTLLQRVQRNMTDLILDGADHSTDDSTEAGHGRIERRRVYVTDSLDWLTPQQRQDWPGLQSVAMVHATRKMLKGDQQVVEDDRRYYLSSLPADAANHGRLIRNHWGIENGQHWCLDMAFQEDQNRVRADHGQENLAALRRIALNLLKQDKSVKLGLKNKRLKASRNLSYLLAIVTGTSNAK